MCKKTFVLITLLLMLGLAGSVSATNYYVRPNGGSYGSEDGSDWSNAFDGFSDVVWGSSSGQVGAGDILYVAGGNYTQTLQPGASGTSDSVRIIVRRATVSEHGTGTGWSSSFDAQVVLPNTAYIRVYQQSYITVDGVTEYGFYVDSPTSTNAYGIYVKDADYVTVQYIKTDGTNNGNDFRGMYWINAGNVKVRHCWFNDCPNDAFMVGDATNSLIEYCILGPRISSSGGFHADGMEIRATENITFRYNEQNWNGDGIQFGIMGGVTTHWDIHGNIFRGGGTAIKTNSVDPSVTQIYIYNNVFYNLYTFFVQRSNTSGIAKNNIFYDVTNVGFSSNVTHDYNWFAGSDAKGETNGVAGGSEDPFVDKANLDFHLDSSSTAIDAGTNLGSTYNTDPDGNTRGQGSGWDIGAYEYVSSGGDTTPPTPNPMTWATDPYATGTTSISMTATTATDSSGVEYYFDCTTTGGHDSGWQDSTTYEDTGLSPSTQYTYRVQARDKSTNQNATSYSTSKSATTDAESDTTPPSPDPMTWATDPYATGTSSISMTATTATDSSGVEYYFDCTTAGGHDSSWQDSTTYEDTGLDPNTQYTYKVKARDKSSNQNETAYSTSKSATTNSGTGAFQQDSGSQGIVSMEAENYDANTPKGSHSWVLITTPTGFSGSAAMRAEPDISTNHNTDYAANSPRLDFEVNFVKTGTHYVWIRGYKTSGTDDSCHAGLEEQEIDTCDRIGLNPTESWEWTNYTMDGPDATFNVSSTGVKTVDVWMREDGFRFDKIVLTVDANYTPTGNGPAESSRGGGDTTAPSPDPMTWATEPYSTGTSSISMTATTATDPCGVEYYFDETSGNPGGSDSSWQDSTTYEDTGLSASTQYTYRVKARDKSSNQNETGYSTTKSATTDALPDTTPPNPDPMTWATVPYATGASSISMTATTATDASGVEYYFDCTAGGGTDSGWQDSTTYEDTGLNELTQYTYRVKARDKSTNQNETAYSTSQSATTQDGTAPSPNPMTWATEQYPTGVSSISMTATTATDASGVEYYFDCTAGGGTDSGWQNSTTYEDTGLDDLTQYTYRVKARDKSANLNETGYSTSKSATTQDGTAPSPDPMTWATMPYATGASSISMTATTATDTSGVEYYFDCTAGGGNDSGWQDSATYEDTGLDDLTEYTYRVKARDKSGNQNETGYSTTRSATTESSTQANLVSWWELDESSGTNADDSSGNNHDGTRSGGSWAPTSGKFDGAVELGTDANDHVEVPTTGMSASAGTVSLWGRIEGTQSASRYFFGHTSGSGPSGWADRMQLYMDNDDNQLDLGLGDSHTTATSIMTLSANTWYHIALTWDSGDYVVYVDGIEKASGTYTGLSTLNSVADIGNNGNTTYRVEAFQGLLDDVRFYDGVLSKYDIADLAGITIASSPSPADEATGVSITADLSWSAGYYAADVNGHDVYFGTDYNSVADANHSSSEFKGNQSSTTYNPGTMSNNTTYYWAIDEVNDTNTWPGNVFSFTTGLDPNLVSWWKLDESSGTNAADSSGNDHDGTLSGGSWAPTSGKYDGAVDLGDANSDRVQVPTTSMSASAGTVALWGRIVGTQSDIRYFFGHTSSPSGWADRIQLYMDNSDNQLDMGLGDSHEKDLNIMTLSADTWYHIALTWDSDDYVVYVDGISKTSGTYTGLSTLGSIADIGNDGNAGYRIEAFQGLLDQVRVYDKALSQSEVQDLAGE